MHFSMCEFAQNNRTAKPCWQKMNSVFFFFQQSMVNFIIQLKNEHWKHMCKLFSLLNQESDMKRNGSYFFLQQFFKIFFYINKWT